MTISQTDLGQSICERLNEIWRTVLVFLMTKISAWIPSFKLVFVKLINLRKVIPAWRQMTLIEDETSFFNCRISSYCVLWPQWVVIACYISKSTILSNSGPYCVSVLSPVQLWCTLVSSVMFRPSFRDCTQARPATTPRCCGSKSSSVSIRSQEACDRGWRSTSSMPGPTPMASTWML